MNEEFNVRLQLMFAVAQHSISGNNFWLSSERSVYWEQQQAIILSDLHLGKTGHFRKAGIAIPQTVLHHDLQRLVQLLEYYHPKEVIIVGDLFHSKENKEMDLFLDWRNNWSSIDFRLVKGNHDILPDNWYHRAGIITHHHNYVTAGFCFTHDPSDCAPGGHYTFSGHVHPGIRISGMGKQSLQFPCYYFGASVAILPAFSHFTGLALLQPEKEDTVFAIVNQSVIAL